jgi:predicted dehydrogenase
VRECPGGDERFREVPEPVAATLVFSGGRVATFTCGFGSAPVSESRLVGTRGDLRPDPACNYSGTLRRFLTIDGSTEERRFDTGDQFAPELIHFSNSILRGAEPRPSGAEGFADVLVIECLARSAETRRPVRLRPAQALRLAGS